MAPAGPLVFVVDDDASVRKSLARLVKAAGYEAEAFASVGDFLARAVRLWGTAFLGFGLSIEPRDEFHAHEYGAGRKSSSWRYLDTSVWSFQRSQRNARPGAVGVAPEGLAQFIHRNERCNRYGLQRCSCHAIGDDLFCLFPGSVV